MDSDSLLIVKEYLSFLRSREFPCVAAKAAESRGHVSCFVSNDMYSGDTDDDILRFLYNFVDHYRRQSAPFHSAAVIFKSTPISCAHQFEDIFWTRMQALADKDACLNGYDSRVSNDPGSAEFSFSIGEEAFFVIGLHPCSSRKSRLFRYPTIVFNPHAEFVALREAGHYEKLKQVVRKRDIDTSGSINPMLDDFGKSAENRQYTGMAYSDDWKCPLKINHESEHNSTP